jgi:serine/threonine protein kinase
MRQSKVVRTTCQSLESRSTCFSCLRQLSICIATAFSTETSNRKQTILKSHSPPFCSENILLGNETIKLADLGSCRGLYNKPPLTEYISTRWYRAPECLMTDGHYGYKMDIWGVGCVFFEVLSLYPLFPGENELDQIHKIHNIMGTPP